MNRLEKQVREDRREAGDSSRAQDSERLGYSLANVKELLLSLLDAVDARSVIEIGAYRGQLTVELLDWASSCRSPYSSCRS